MSLGGLHRLMPMTFVPARGCYEGPTLETWAKLADDPVQVRRLLGLGPITAAEEVAWAQSAEGAGLTLVEFVIATRAIANPDPAVMINPRPTKPPPPPAPPRARYVRGG